MFKKVLFPVFLFLFLYMFQSNTLAHGVGQSFPKEVGNYILEFEYENPEILSDEVNSFVFRLLDKTSKTPVPFDYALIRFEVKSDQSTYLVTRLAQDELQDGVVRITSILNKDDYLITSAYYKDSNKIAEASYDLSVIAGEKDKKTPFIFAGFALGGLILGFLVAKIGLSHKSPK